MKELIQVLKELENTNQQLGLLKAIKEELEQLILLQLENKPEEGQKTYEVYEYKLLVKTGLNYTIDKDKYDSLEIPQDINPIKTSIKYEVDLKKIRELKVNHGSLFSEFITETPKKVHLTLGYRS